MSLYVPPLRETPDKKTSESKVPTPPIEQKTRGQITSIFSHFQKVKQVLGQFFKGWRKQAELVHSTLEEDTPPLDISEQPDQVFTTLEGDKMPYNQERLTIMQSVRTLQNIQDDVKRKIEEHSSDVEERESGKEGQIFRVKVTINGFDQYVIAMKRRRDNDITHEVAMLEKANNLLLLSDNHATTMDTERLPQAEVPNYYWSIKVGEENYLLMEYIGGSTLYTLILETIIKTLIQKIPDTPLLTEKEWAEESLTQFQNAWGNKKKAELKSIEDLKNRNIQQARAAYSMSKLSKEQKEQKIAEAISGYEAKAKEDEAPVKEKYSLKGTHYKQALSEQKEQLSRQYNLFLQKFNEYKDLVRAYSVSFARDSVAEKEYTRIRDEYYEMREGYKPIVKGSFYNIPDVSGRGLMWTERDLMTDAFLDWVVKENLAIFSEEDAQDAKSRVKNTLDLFHINDLYHRDLGKNLRNLMFRMENGQFQRDKNGKIMPPVIIDFGHAIVDEKYEEGVSAKYDPLHSRKSSEPERRYAVDRGILAYITSTKAAA